MNQQRLIAFMRNLIRQANQKIFLILDNLKVHHGKLVAKWLAKHKDKIELFFLPPYAPESNPDEYLNHTLKLSVHSGDLPRTSSDIRRPDRKFCVKGDKRQSKKEEQIQCVPTSGTDWLNSAYPPGFRDGRRYARAA